MSSDLLTLEGVHFAYEGNPWALAVDRLRFGEERITGIVGPNGSGKSTLLRIAAGLETPDEGTVTLKGSALRTMGRRRIARTLGFLPQDVPPLFDYTVNEVVWMGRYAHLRGVGAATDADREAVEEAVTAVEIGELRTRSLSRLSGGERRRALIASVLAQAPEILLLDEPTSSLDVHHAAAVMRLLSGFGTSGPAVVVVTHDINLAALFCDRLLLLSGGCIFADGSAHEVVRPKIMRSVYGEDLLIRPHPETQCPMVLPAWGAGPNGKGGGRDA